MENSETEDLNRTDGKDEARGFEGVGWSNVGDDGMSAADSNPRGVGQVKRWFLNAVIIYIYSIIYDTLT